MSAEPMDVLEPLFVFLSIYLLILAFGYRGLSEVEKFPLGLHIAVVGYIISVFSLMFYMFTVVVSHSEPIALVAGLAGLSFSMGGYGIFMWRNAAALSKVEP